MIFTRMQRSRNRSTKKFVGVDNALTTAAIATISARKANIAAGQSAAGSEWAKLPQ